MGLKDCVIIFLKKDKPIIGMHHGVEGFLNWEEIQLGRNTQAVLLTGLTLLKNG